MIQVDMQYSGPIVLGLTDPIMSRATVAMADKIAQAGKELIDAELPRVLKNPTGYYQSQIQVTNAHSTNPRVTDGGVIYGPWLEGVGSRNRTTRFKGYSTFRRMRQRLDSQVLKIIQPTVDRVVKELGG